jgi:site-specific recombinase XerD
VRLKTGAGRSRGGYLRRLLPTLARRAGIAERVHAHGLRQTRAAELPEEGVEIRVISTQLGHSDISTTARYWLVFRDPETNRFPPLTLE